MKKIYLVANWKMNFSIGEASIYLHKLSQQITASRDLNLILAPGLLALQPLSLQVDRRKFKLAAQNCYHRDFGAFTGEVSASQLRGLVDYCLIGHSERRHIFGETDKTLRQKVAATLRHNITPILCIGETAIERSFGETVDVIKDQLIGGLSEVAKEELDRVIIAYEPVWAISSTKDARPASPEDIAEALQNIRQEITALYGSEVGERMTILFGGSVNQYNAGAYLTIKGCNGLLVGSASLIAPEFREIVEIAKRVAR